MYVIENRENKKKKESSRGLPPGAKGLKSRVGRTNSYVPPSQPELHAKEYRGAEFEDMGKHSRYSFACSSGYEGGRHMTQCDYLFGQLFS